MTLRQWIREPRRGLVKLLKRRGRPALNRVLARYSLVGDPPVFDVCMFPFCRELEANWQAIRREAERVLAYRAYIPSFQEISPDQYRISDDDMWKTFWFRGFGYRSAPAYAACPETGRLLDAIPGLETALFSILAPRKHIPPHRGVYKGIINYHLGLIVPRRREACRIRVGNEFIHWEEGKSAVFDDTYEHEVWNDTDDERVVLMMQFRRPLRFPGDQLSRVFLGALRLTPYVTRAHENHERWERHFGEIFQRDAAANGPAEPSWEGPRHRRANPDQRTVSVDGLASEDAC